MVRRWIYDTDYHRKARERQRKYDSEIAEIMKEHNCSFKEAHDIRIERLRKEAREELKRRGIK